MSISEQAMAFSRLLATMREELLSAHIGTIENAPLYRIAEREGSFGIKRCCLINHDGDVVASWREGVEWESGSTVGRIVFEVL